LLRTSQARLRRLRTRRWFPQQPGGPADGDRAEREGRGSRQRSGL